MESPVRVLIHGGNGRMGQSLQRLCRNDGRFEPVGAVSRKVGPRVVDGVPQFAASELAGAPAFDVAVDFSLPEGFDRVLGMCLSRGKPLVSGTTGLTDVQQAALAAAATRIPIAWAANFSLGVALLHDLVARAARALPGWNCDIIESHHTRKQDAPSGTALSLGALAAEQGAEPRYASIRAGDIVGEHTVQFTTAGERIELIHRAGDREIFARGALHVAKALHGQAPGLYRVADLLG